MKGRRVFVTGGAGVIGRELVHRLVAVGARVFVGDLKPRPDAFDASVRYRQGDLNDLTQSEYDAFDPEILIHLAATFERSTETAGFWDENFRHNLALSHHLMTIAQRGSSLRKVVFASSYLVYDPDLYLSDSPWEKPRDLAETDPIRPRNLIGMAKLQHEMELQFLSGIDGVRFSTLCARIFRGYGRGSRDVISRWARALLAGEPISVYRPEGIFDYVYAADTAEGLLRLAICEKAVGIVNLGTGRARRVADVVAILRGIFPDARIETADADIPFEASQADNSLLRELLDWEPTSDLEKTIPEIVAYERSRLVEVGPDRTGNRARNVLVTSASRKAPLLRAMRDALRRMDPDAQVIAGDLDPEAPAQHVSDGFWQMPRIVDDAIREIVEGCGARGIGVILPTRDGELPFWARHRGTLEKSGISVIVSDSDAIEQCTDKLAFARFCMAAGLPAIETGETPESVGKGPYVVKERFGSGSRGIGLDLPLDRAQAHAGNLESPIFQPFVPGPEISVDGWIDRDGVVAGVVLRRRDRVVGGESQVTTTFRDEALEQMARRVLQVLRLRGPVVMQAIVVDGALRIIECNPRFGGASTAGIAAGLDSFHWSLAEAFGSRAEPRFQRIDGEVRLVRLPSDIVIHDPRP